MDDGLRQEHSTVVGDIFGAYKTMLLEFLVKEFGHEREIHIALLHSALRDVEAIARFDFLNRVSEARAKALANNETSEGEEK